RDRKTHPAIIGRGAAGRDRLVISRLAQTGRARLDYRFMGEGGQRETRQVLPADSIRQKTTVRRAIQKGPVYEWRDPCLGSGGRRKDDRDKRESELREELEFHLEQETEERSAAGLSLEEARYAARRDLGNLTLVMENTRAAWGVSFFDNLQRDIRFSARWLY